jgi:hypothetical protein
MRDAGGLREFEPRMLRPPLPDGASGTKRPRETSESKRCNRLIEREMTVASRG